MLTPAVTEIPSLRRAHNRETTMPSADQQHMNLKIQGARAAATAAAAHQTSAADALGRASEQVRAAGARALRTADALRGPARSGRLR